MIQASMLRLNARKLAFRLFREEQKDSSTLKDLSAIQRGKVIKKMFKELNKTDTEALVKRASALEAKKAGSPGVSAGLRRKVSMTPYELFYKEQSTNPSIASIRSLGERERRLFVIFNSLPDSAKEALENRARQISESGDFRTSSSPTSSSSPKKSKKVTKSPLRSSNNTRTTTKKKTNEKKKNKKSKPKANKKVKSKKTIKKAPPSPYAIFVKEHMPEVKHLPVLERMKVIAQKWKASKPPASPSEKAKS